MLLAAPSLAVGAATPVDSEFMWRLAAALHYSPRSVAQPRLVIVCYPTKTPSLLRCRLAHRSPIHWREPARQDNRYLPERKHS